MNFDLESALGDKPQETLPVAALLILAAGMLDAYTYVGYGGVFANAMTGNLVVMTVKMSGGDLSAALPYLAPLAAYVCGVAVAHCVTGHRQRDGGGDRRGDGGAGPGVGRGAELGTAGEREDEGREPRDPHAVTRPRAASTSSSRSGTSPGS